MAVVIGPALSLQASGDLGAINYSRWRGLAIARSKYIPVQPNTSIQVAQQNILIAVSQYWKLNSTQEIKREWNAIASDQTWRDRLGTAWHPRGYFLYMKINMNRQVWGIPINIKPPVIDSFPLVTTITACYENTPPKITVTISGWAATREPYGVQIWRAGPFDNPGRTALPCEYRLFQNKTPVGSYSDTAVIADKYYWYKMRAFEKFGGYGNFHYIQKQAAVYSGSNLGVELIDNGSFDTNIDDWNNDGGKFETFEWQAGTMHAIDSTAGGIISQASTSRFSVTKDRKYLIKFNNVLNSGSAISISIVRMGGNKIYFGQIGTLNLEMEWISNETMHYLEFRFWAQLGATDFNIDDITVREILQ